MALKKLLFSLVVSVIVFSKDGDLTCPVDPYTSTYWPSLVSLNNGTHHFCSGSLITTQWVLTSASCMSRRGPGNTVVHLGIYNEQPPDPPVSRTVASMECHPDYDNVTAENDICLLNLSAPVAETHYVYPVYLLTKENFNLNDIQVEIPLAPDMENMEGNITLQVISTTVVGNNECSCIHGRRVPDNSVCVGSPGDDYDCEVDLGSLVIDMYDTQIGIVSFGSSWVNTSTPRSYTRVSEYDDWILNITMDSEHFLSFIYNTTDREFNFTCPTREPPTRKPPTRKPPTREPPTRKPPTREPPTHQPLTDDKSGGSVFDSGESVIIFSTFTHLASVCILSLYLWVFI